VRWRLSNAVLTLARFRRGFGTAGDKSDFITYYRAEMTERSRKGKITFNTRKNHLRMRNGRLAFRPVIPFHILTTDFADDCNHYFQNS